MNYFRGETPRTAANHEDSEPESSWSPFSRLGSPPAKVAATPPSLGPAVNEECAICGVPLLESSPGQGRAGPVRNVDRQTGETFCSSCWRDGSKGAKLASKVANDNDDDSDDFVGGFQLERQVGSDVGGHRLRFRCHRAAPVINRTRRAAAVPAVAAAAKKLTRRTISVPSISVPRGPPESLVLELLTGSALQRSRRALELEVHPQARGVLYAAVKRIQKMAKRSGGERNLSTVDQAILKLGRKLLHELL